MWELFQSARLRRLFLAETVILLLVSSLCTRLCLQVGSPGLQPLALLSLFYHSLLSGVFFSVATQISMYYLGLYSNSPIGSRTLRLAHLLLAHVLSGCGLSIWVLVVPQLHFPKVALWLSIAIGSWLLFSLRCLFDEVLQNDHWRRRVLIVGTGSIGKSVAGWILAFPGAGYKLVGYLSADRETADPQFHRPVLGSCSHVLELVLQHEITDVVFALDSPDDAVLSKLLIVKQHGRKVWSSVHFATEVLHRFPVELLSPDDIVFDPGFTPSPFALVVKRMGDVLLSAVAIAVLSLVFLVLALLIRLDSPGPVFYRQQRIGLRGRRFTIYKFRSMVVSDEKGPLRLTEHNDGRITKVGRFMRLHRLDELPQFFNVLRGDMSLVGPRPEVEQSVAELRRILPLYDQRHAILPGITSLGQVRFGAATTTREAQERLGYDLYYQKHMSLAFDLSILIDTVKVVLLKTGAR